MKWVCLLVGSWLLLGCQAAITSEIQVTETILSPPTIISSPTAMIAPTATVVPTTGSVLETDANADVAFVRAVANGPTWTFHVTVDHPDTGWEDYADGWDVVLPDGTVLKVSPDSPFTRLLLHPHETERPFTRSQSGLVIPAAVTEVRVRAHDLVAGFGGQEVVVDLTQSAGDKFTVDRDN